MSGVRTRPATAVSPASPVCPSLSRPREVRHRPVAEPPARAPANGHNARVTDDLRLTVAFEKEDDARELVSWLADARLDAADRDRLGERVIVSRDGASVFVYAAGEAEAREIKRLIEARVGHLAAARIALDRWHPIAQGWEDAEVPLPTTEEELTAEHGRRQAREAAESRRSGHAEWEVRVELDSPEATRELAERLERDGVPVIRRSTFLLVGAVNEDQAHALAERLAEEAPDGARIEVEPGGQMVWEVVPANPFAVFGGLGV